jgi:hypothetical protein
MEKTSLYQEKMILLSGKVILIQTKNVSLSLKLSHQNSQ